MLSRSSIDAYLKKYREELFQSSIPFWATNGPDREHGGFFTNLDRMGNITSHDKSGWHQGRTAWTFSRLCNLYGENENHLRIAKSCLDFLNRHLFDPASGRMYFSVAGDGTPLRLRRYSYNSTEIFAVYGLAEYSRASGDAAALAQAKDIYAQLAASLDGKGRPAETSELKYLNRPFRSWGGYMCFLECCDILCMADPENSARYKAKMREYASIVLQYFYKEELGCILENVGPNGEFLSDWSLGREVNPGHGLEGVWFLAKTATRLNDPYILEMAQKIYAGCLERGWDQEYGGILMFVDALGMPPEKYEHDMKFWWVIGEAICAAITLYHLTNNETYWKDFEKFSSYYFDFFSDREYGDCFGYLRRDGKPTEPIAKGNLYKGAFHIPRTLMHTIQLLEDVRGTNEF